MQTEIKNHRLGAFVYGFISGLGLIIIIWGFASIIALPSRSSTIYVGLILSGVLLFAGGSCREAYLRGGLSVQPSIRRNFPATRAKPVAAFKPTGQPQMGTTAQSVYQEPTNLNPVTTEQIKEYPIGTQTHETVVHKEEQQT